MLEVARRGHRQPGLRSHRKSHAGRRGELGRQERRGGGEAGGVRDLFAPRKNGGSSRSLDVTRERRESRVTTGCRPAWLGEPRCSFWTRCRDGVWPRPEMPLGVGRYKVGWPGRGHRRWRSAGSLGPKPGQLRARQGAGGSEQRPRGSGRAHRAWGTETRGGPGSPSPGSRRRETGRAPGTCRTS